MIRKTSAIYVTRGAYSNMGEKRMEFRSIVGNSLIISIITIRPCISMNVDPNFNVNWYNIYCEKTYTQTNALTTVTALSMHTDMGRYDISIPKSSKKYCIYRS